MSYQVPGICEMTTWSEARIYKKASHHLHFTLPACWDMWRVGNDTLSSGDMGGGGRLSYCILMYFDVFYNILQYSIVF